MSVIALHHLTSGFSMIASEAPNTAIALCMLNPKYYEMSFLENARGQWVVAPGGAAIAYYPTKTYFNELWHHVLKNWVQSQLYKAAVRAFPSRNADEKVCGMRKSTWRNLVVSAVRSILHHPFRVGHLYYSLQPNGSALNIASTMQAMSKIASLHPFYLFSGLVEELVSQLSSVVIIQELVVPNIAFLKKKSLILHDLALTGLVVLVGAPTATLSSIARANSPLIRELTAFRPSYTSYWSAVAGIWREEGISGFYRGWPFMLAQRFISWVWFRSTDYLISRHRLYQTSLTRTIAFSGIFLLSFASDLSLSFPRKFPWEETPSSNTNLISQ